MNYLRRILVYPFILLIRTYQTFVSRGCPRVCVYSPTCSEYAVLALREHGLLHGLRLAWRRYRTCTGGEHRGLDLPPGVEREQVPDGEPEAPTRLTDLESARDLDELPEHLRDEIRRRGDEGVFTDMFGG